MSIGSRMSLFLVVSVAACGTEMSEAPDEAGETSRSQQAANVPATAPTVTGTCARLEEVGMEFPSIATFKEAGGWTTFNPSGNGITGWSAIARESCNTFNTQPSTSNKNRVVCYYTSQTFGSWEGPQLGASKTFPSQYNCTCVPSTGKYTCVRQGAG